MIQPCADVAGISKASAIVYEISVGAVRARADHQVADAFDYIQIGTLVAAADIVGLVDNATLERSVSAVSA